MRISDIIAVILTITAVAAFCCFFFYPYTELNSLQEKTNIAVSCVYVAIASAIGLAITAIADRD